MERALELHQAGRLAEAETLFREVLARDPGHAAALCLLGRLAAEVGQPWVAVQLFERSVTVAPNNAAVWSDFGNALHGCGRFADAARAHSESLRLAPDRAVAWNDLGNALHAGGHIEEAIPSYRESLRREPVFIAAKINLANALDAGGHSEEAAEAYEAVIRWVPENADAHFRLGNIQASRGEAAKAIASFREAVRLDPLHSEAHNHFGNMLLGQGQFDESIGCYCQAIRLNPQYSQAFSNLGHALLRADRVAEAVAACREAVRLNPNEVAAHANLGVALRLAGRTDEAVIACRQAIHLDPNCGSAYDTLGNCLKDEGLLNDAVECLRKVVSLRPAAADAHSNLIYTLNFHPGYSSQELLSEARRWNRQHAQRFQAGIRVHGNDRTSDRRMRVGYVSPDFRRHVVGFNLLPLLREHDHEGFEIYCYSNSSTADAVTAEIRSLTNHWRDITAATDDQAEETIRSDQIDILVDLTMHMASNRLLLFARKPAPVQATYLAYCGTSGLDTMDYRFSDHYLDPPGADLDCYSETTIRLPRTYWCYEPGGPTPPSSPPPPPTDGVITFGCLNNFAKVSPEARQLWARILSRLPCSRLLMHAAEGSCREAVRECFRHHGVAQDRLEFIGVQSWEGFLRHLQRIDIALDPFPYGGGITTCDSLWMGAPVVTLLGNTAVGRGGSSILHNIGLPELVAPSPEQYEETAISLAQDRPRLEELRSSLRRRMTESPLRDAKGFARDMEAAYRTMWREWCAGKSRAS